MLFERYVLVDEATTERVGELAGRQWPALAPGIWNVDVDLCDYPGCCGLNILFSGYSGFYNDPQVFARKGITALSLADAQHIFCNQLLQYATSSILSDKVGGYLIRTITLLTLDSPLFRLEKLTEFHNPNTDRTLGTWLLRRV